MCGGEGRDQLAGLKNGNENVKQITQIRRKKTALSEVTNSTFCPLTVFMCFVWISEQTAIISLYNIN